MTAPNHLTILENKNQKRQDLAKKRQEEFLITQSTRLQRKLPALYENCDKKVRKKYKLDKNYDSGIFWALAVAIGIGVLSVSHPQVATLGLILALGCLAASGLVVVRNLTNKKDREQKNQLIRDEVNAEFKKRVVNIQQEFVKLKPYYESMGFQFPQIAVDTQDALDYSQKQLKLN